MSNQKKSEKLSYSINPHGKNKIWNYEVLTTSFEDKVDTIAELKATIKAGHAITGAHFKGQRRKTANVSQVGLLLVDVDKGMRMEEAKADPFIAQHCAIAYTTTSHSSEHHKYRLVFPLPRPMGRDDFEALVKIFLKQFPHDPSCKDAGRAFYGNTEADFFIDNPDACLPQNWIDQAIADAKAEKERREKMRQERAEWLKNNPIYTSPDAVPLIKCCNKEVRDLIDGGVPVGSGHNDAALKIAMELIAVEQHLSNIGQPFSGSAREHYDRFLLASGVDDHKAEQRWEWAESREGLDTSIPPETIEKLICAHEFSQLKTGPERDQYRKNHPSFTSLNGDKNSEYQVKSGGDHQTIKEDKNGDRAIAIAQKITKVGTLGDRYSNLLNVADETTEDILKAAVLMANDCLETFEELEQWIKSSFKAIAKTKLKQAISIVGVVIGQWGDETISSHFQQLIKDNSHLTRIDLVSKIFKSATNTVNPPPTQKEMAMNAVRRCYNDGFKYNELTGKIELNGAEFKDVETAYMHPELIKVDVSKTFATDAILVLGKQKKYHPVKDYLESLEKTTTLSDEQWDNLALYLLGTDDQLAQIILKKALIAAVARIYKPGCYVRMIPVLRGHQNAGKSTFFQLLAGNEFFSDSLGKLDNPKDDYQLLHSYWIHEWGEIDKLNKKSTGDVKAFITKTKDDYRAPYARSPETHQRQCVIFGSCNRDDFLKDSTGNTRFSVIEVGKINLELVKECRDSIWATAKARFEAGEQWELTQAEQALSEVNNQAYTELDPWHEEIETFLSLRQEVSVSAILDHLDIETSKKDSRNAKRVRDVLTTLGWRKDKNPSTYQGQRTRLWRSTFAPCTTDTTVMHNPNIGCAGVVQGVVQVESLSNQQFRAFDTTCTTKNIQNFSSEISQKNLSPLSPLADEKTREFSENFYKENGCAGCVDLTELLTLQGIEVCTTPAQPPTQPPCTTSDPPLVGCAELSPITLDISDAKLQKIVKQLLAAKTLADLKQSKRQWGEDVFNFVLSSALTDDQKAQLTNITHSVKKIVVGSKVTFVRYDGLMGGGTVMEINALGTATLSTGELLPIDGLIVGGAA